MENQFCTEYAAERWPPMVIPFIYQRIRFGLRKKYHYPIWKKENTRQNNLKRFLICSDIHQCLEVLQAILEREPVFDGIIIAGDLEVSPKTIRRMAEKIPLYVVRGNHDTLMPFCFFIFPRKKCIFLGKHKILLLHGDQQGVPELTFLRKEAKRRRADVVIFGHTHEYFDQFQDGIRYLNPGSLMGWPHRGMCSYLVMELDREGEINVRHRII